MFEVKVGQVQMSGGADGGGAQEELVVSPQGRSSENVWVPTAFASGLGATPHVHM
jgi:hypothetical protein